MSDAEAPVVDTLTLETTGIILSSLCGLFGVYFVLVILGLWSTYRHNNASSKRLRIVTIVLFIDLLIHFLVRALQFARARRLDDSDEELLKWGIPLLVIGNVTTTFAGLCSDGLLAWRFYVIFGRKAWAKWIPAVLVVINAMLCWSADAQHLAIYHHYDFYENVLYDVTLKITAAWGWLMFVINTAMTGLIVWKILSVSKNSYSAGSISQGGSKYETILRALIESAAVTWVGILMYEIASLAPTGGITDHMDVGYVMASILPVFFGISQCLITFRLGFTKEMSGDSSSQSRSGASSFRAHVPRTPISSGGTKVAGTATDYTTSMNSMSHPYGYSSKHADPDHEMGVVAIGNDKHWAV